MTTTASIEARRAALLTHTATGELLKAAELLDALGQTKSPEQRMTAAWISDEIERRVGIIRDDELAAFDAALDETGSYIAALKRLRPALAR
ncbi:hypothetical protein I5G67_gp094 [Mycobacterium phage Aminay]|uniref:Uncharacterized protein n=1 Tax=Mycobacterium phage Aminay TaxID=2250291 RepID=A0A345KV78_9CAUD|nr:hypothetical protein I5G67_gp094 [Mycobacterium phage Aminay]AXH46930.1 hypothetical protein SEA_AMINAY_94 [Mycobacterium phage Aminay]